MRMKTMLAMLICTISYTSVYSQQPPPPPPSDEEIFQVVEEMPRFPGCKDEPKKKRNDCANKKLLEFIYKNIKYPAEARRDSIEGTVVVQFVIQKNGSISQAKIVKKVGGGCDEEVLRVVSLMPIWEPGRQRGRAVRVRYTLPVKFRLD